MYMIYCKYCKYMIIILSHFFVTTADYQFSKVPTKPTKQSACGNDEDVTTYEGPPKFNSYF